MLPLRLHKPGEEIITSKKKFIPCFGEPLLLFDKAGENGLTDYELGMHYKKTFTSVRYTRFHLKNLGLVKDSGFKRETRENKKNHRKSTVWCITDKGVQKAQELKGDVS